MYKKKHVCTGLTCSVLVFALVLSAGGTARAVSYTWEKVACPLPSAGAALAVHDGKFYRFGGNVSGPMHNENCTDAIWSYDPSTHQWQEKSGKLPYAFAPATGKPIVVANRLIMSPGFGPTISGGWASHSRVIEYNFDTGQAAETASYPVGTIWGCTIAKTRVEGQDRVYSFGGWNGGPVSSIYRYDLTTQSLNLVSTATSEGNGALSYSTDLSGNIITFGNGIRRGLVQIFDPHTETMTYMGDILPADLQVSDLMAWTDPAGAVLVAGVTTGNVYAFDSATKVFALTALMLSTPSVTPGFEMCGSVHDDETGRIYLMESQRDAASGGSWGPTNLWVGTPVPEPATVSLLLLGGIALVRRRHRTG